MGLIVVGTVAAVVISRSGGSIENPPAELQASKTLVYFSSENCKPCQKFEASQELQLQSEIEGLGVRYRKFTTPRYEDLRNKNIFGEFTSTFRAATDSTRKVVVPTFAYVENGKLIDARTDELKELMVKIASRVEAK